MLACSMARECSLAELAFDMELDEEELCEQNESVMHSAWTESEHRTAHSTTGWTSKTTEHGIPMAPASFKCVVDALFSFSELDRNLPHKISSDAARWSALNSSAFHREEASYDSDFEAAAADDDDVGLQYYLSGIVGVAMRARLAVKFKLLHNRRLAVKDKLLRCAFGIASGNTARGEIENAQSHHPAICA